MATQRRLVLSLTDVRNDFVRAISADAEAAARRCGASLSVQTTENEAVKQIQQIFEALRAPEAKRPDAILIWPAHDEAFERVARAVVGAGIGWVCLHRATGDIDSLRSAFPNVPVCVVGPDQLEIGRIQGRLLLSMLPDGGKVLYLEGRAANLSTTQRATGLREVIAGSRIELAAVLDGNWSTVDAEQAVNRWLRLLAKVTPVDAVVCQNDAMAIGARRALQEAARTLALPELKAVPIIGCDGLPTIGRHLVDTGEMVATVVLPIPSGPAVEVAIRALENGAMPPSQIRLEPQSYPRTLSPRPRAVAAS